MAHTQDQIPTIKSIIMTGNLCAKAVLILTVGPKGLHEIAGYIQDTNGH